METPLPSVTRRQFGGWGISGNRSSVDAQGLGEVSAGLAGLSQTLRRGLASRKAGQSKEAESQREYGKHLYSASKIEFDKRLNYFATQVKQGKLKPYQVIAFRDGGFEAQGIQLVDQIYGPAVNSPRGEVPINEWLAQHREEINKHPQVEAILSSKYSTKVFEEKLAEVDDAFRKFNADIVKEAQQQNSENAHISMVEKKFESWANTPKQIRSRDSDKDLVETFNHPSGIFKDSYLRVLNDAILPVLISKAGESGRYDTHKKSMELLNEVIDLNWNKEGAKLRGKAGVQKVIEQAYASFINAEKVTRDRNQNSLSALAGLSLNEDGQISKDGLYDLADKMIGRGEISKEIAYEWIHDHFGDYGGVPSKIDGENLEVTRLELVGKVERGEPWTKEDIKTALSIKKAGGFTESAFLTTYKDAVNNEIYTSFLGIESNKKLIEKFENYFVYQQQGFLHAGIIKAQGPYFDFLEKSHGLFGKGGEFELTLDEQSQVQGLAVKYIENLAMEKLEEKIEEFKEERDPDKTWKNYQDEVYAEVNKQYEHVRTQIGDRFVLDSLTPDEKGSIKSVYYDVNAKSWQVEKGVKELITWVVTRNVPIKKTDLYDKASETQKGRMDSYIASIEAGIEKPKKVK